MSLQGAIAATRFGMGAKPGEIEAASSDPRGWLKAQIAPNAALVPADGLKDVQTAIRDQQEAYRGLFGPNGQALKPKEARQEAKEAKADAKEAKSDGDPKPQGDGAALLQARQMAQREIREGLLKEVDAKSKHAVETAAPFAERWARFWSNHFTVAARNMQLIPMVGPFEREAIRPHVFGNFATLLGASTFHPCMLTYLDAAKSFGPSTEAAQKRKVGLNENLAREILELHTMGVGSGYTQADIIEFAKALTGWTVGGPQTARMMFAGGQGQGAGLRPGFRRQERVSFQGGAAQMNAMIGATVFVEPLHEPGARTVVGKSYGGPAKTQAAMILDDLARSKATAHHIATKLVRHFVSDTPPPAAVAKIEAVFLRTGGNLADLARAVIDLDEAWGETQQKFKTPDELLVSAGRATGQEVAYGANQRGVYQALAQQPFNAPSPAGWPDDTASWSGADAIKKRLEWANAVSRRMVRGESPSDFLDRALGPVASARTRQAVARAETAEQGFTIALMSPEFQRR
ncbi:MAG TPA: DUF1800 family protein [Hyphomonadaceae bacterium]|nr:DUF1800 family protein [Hyphomonadaceae bacterium]